jgi:microcystin-dependent protein
MLCSNCYTGCVQITTDKCMRYTGLDSPLLGIKSGDSQSYVNQALIGFVSANSDGTGVKFTLVPEDSCDLITKYYTDCKDITVVDHVRALSKALCEQDALFSSLEETINLLEENYVPGCLDTIDGSEGTHVILQATIDLTCSNLLAINAINLDLTTNYVKVADINQYIADYISENTGEAGLTGMQTKMVPYTVVEYYGITNHFDATGAGQGEWVNIYLCNGNNGTPDKRGRIPIGTTIGMLGGSFPAATDPAVPGNPNYSVRDVGGTNTVTLTISQIPSHTHTGSTSTDPGHTHTYKQYELDQTVAKTGSGVRALNQNNNQVGSFVTNTSGSHSHIFTTAASGSGSSHSNIQPVLACHYIMYIPVL